MNLIEGKRLLPAHPGPRPRLLLPRALRISVLLALAACSGGEGGDVSLYRVPPPDNVVDGVVWEAGDWEPHLRAGSEGFSWGNHRAVVVLEEAGTGAGATTPEAVAVTIPWRRRDPHPGSKAVVVVDADTGKPVPNALVLRSENASGEVVFQPNPGSGTYHVYFLPWHSSGGYYPTVTYPTPAVLRDPALRAPAAESPSRAERDRAATGAWEGLPPLNDPGWEARVRETGAAALPRARTTRIQSVDAFHSFFPMEVIATPEETDRFMEEAPNGWLLVPEHRDLPIRMRRFVPRYWVDREELDSFSSPVLRGESFALQLGLVAGDGPLSDVEVSFEGFPGSWVDGLTCFNCGGVDEKGAPFIREVDVPAGEIRPLWIGLQIPADEPSGPVEGRIIVSTSNRGSKTLRVLLDVRKERAPEGGSSEPELMTRLSWLNSTLGSDSDYIIEPFLPVDVDDHTLSILGRRIRLGESGLPAAMESYFPPEMTHLAEEPRPILARPVELRVTLPGGVVEPFRTSAFQVEEEARGRARWTAVNTSDHFRMTVEGTLEYEGMLGYRIALTALDDVAVEDIALPVAYDPGAAEYMLGLGRMGGVRPSAVDWKWAVENHQEGVWLGGVNRGLQYVLRDDNYLRPLNTNFYRNQPLRMPPSWYNEGKGGIRIREEGGAVMALNYSGPRRLAAGETLHFNVRFLVTPFKPIDTRRHFDTRFVHMYVPVDSVRAWGGTVVNIHHANEINPYINYPFYNLEEQAAYIDEAHAKGIKVKLYYTIRELTYKAHELFPLRSLGDEILNDGEGGGHSWLQEHLADHYHAGWHAWRVDDAAVLDKGTSRWTNYYVEGLSWLAEHQEIDGLYLDDIAFSRETVKRMVNVLYQRRPEVVIDLHSANQFNVRDGFINSAMLYMEHFPFINRLWFGEYFDYGRPPDYWMTEVSGLPFGLMGEMLQGGGHPYRGMLYGMTARMYGDVDPRPVWGLMNDFGIADSEMRGYWLDDTPVRTGNPLVLATTYVRPDGVFIALGSWSDTDEVVDLTVDWNALGPAWASGRAGGSGGVAAGVAGPPNVRAFAPAVDGLQPQAEVDLSAVRVPAGEGLFVLLVPT